MGQKVTFGEKLEGVQYKIRQGVYAVILNQETDSVAVVKTSTGCFLPGGGIESGESHEECLKRECLEEIGYEIGMGDFIGRAEKSSIPQPSMSTWSVMVISTLLMSSKKIDVPTEDDHELVWIPENDLENSLFHEHQIWAVRQAISLMAD